MAWDENSAGGRPDGAGRRPAADQGPAPAWIDSRALLGNKDEVWIKHGDQMYRLKLTRHGKLILNK